MERVQILPFSKATKSSRPARPTPRLHRNARIPYASEHTICIPIICSGIGLHSGKYINLKLLPAPSGTGIVFRRTDIDDTLIPALYHNVVDTRFSTVIASPANPAIKIATIEHLMSSLAGNQIDNIIIECDGPELPVLDGSAANFDSLLEYAGRKPLLSTAPVLKVLKTVRVEDNGAFAELRPSVENMLSLDLSIDFASSVIGQQRFTMDLTPENFKSELSYCRTFTFKEEINALHKMGLAKGGSLDNAIVVDNERVLNPDGLRCKDEFVRHKMLDAIGDLSLINARICGKFVGYKSGHTLNNLLVRKLMSQKESWCYLSSPIYPARVVPTLPFSEELYQKQEA